MQVDVGLSEGREYTIEIGAGMLEQVGVLCARVARSARVVVVTQPSIERHWGAAVVGALRGAGFTTDVVRYPAGERYKTLTTLERLYRDLYALRPALDRKTLLVALGGGVVGDMAGFLAATYLRGLDYVQIPTTLLAMVDSSVGGKTGVDFQEGKNLIGAFHQPRLVTIDPAVLATLPRRELHSGLAEVIKYGVIQEPELLTLIAGSIARIRQHDPDLITQLVARSCTIKAGVVVADEREETGLRAILNFGHTIGHALESATGYKRYKHGEAIAIGMVAAALIGEAAGVTPPDVTAALCSTLDVVGLAWGLPEDISDEVLLSLTARDKKAEAGSARFVLASALGQVALQPVAEECVRAGLRQHRVRSKAG